MNPPDNLATQVAQKEYNTLYIKVYQRIMQKLCGLFDKKQCDELRQINNYGVFSPEVLTRQQSHINVELLARKSKCARN